MYIEEANIMNTVSNEATIEQEAYRLLTKTFILLDDCDRRFFSEYGLSTRQFWAIQHLDEQQGCSMIDLSRVLFTDKSNVTSIVDRLENRKLVTRTTDPHDRRIVLITLTEEGRRLRNRVNEQHDLRIRELMHVENPAAISSLVDCLQAISRNIETYLEPTISKQLT
jgi:DNA-binding MarR family transcriptional regulator